MKNYLDDRKTKTMLNYGLRRRTEVVIEQCRQFSFPKPCVVLDIGTADGLMLGSLIKHYGRNGFIGIGLDLRFSYLKAAKENVPHALQADGRWLPLCTNSVDVILSTAVFKHIKKLDNLLMECRRVLKPSGKMIITDPTPFGIRLGVLLGYFSRQSIVQIPSLKTTQQMLSRCDFKTIYAGRFMLSPIPFIGSDIVEGALARVHLNQLFFNQVICAKCSVS